ncbi:DUF1134 domain-containing protein [Alphaproteobacteria bacterium]|jgi:hypothetical protein|nr:DUF1134 domain-containing protein [Alphaproteobacteria bacterium]
MNKKPNRGLLNIVISMARNLAIIASILSLNISLLGSVNPASAQDTVKQIEDFSESKIIIEAAKFLGTSAESMAEIVGKLMAEYGEPSAIIKGEEVSAAIMLGLRYGHGEVVFKTGERQPIYWRGPSAGVDTGGNAAKSFALIYGARNPRELHKRFGGVEGAAFYIAGISINFMERGDIIIAPMRAGVGMRLGVNIGYTKYSKSKGWFPF